MGDNSQPEENSTLSPIQIQALALLLAGETKIATAKQLGISRQTMTAWCNHNEVFKQALADGQAMLLDELNRRLLAVAGAAVGYLSRVLKRPRNQSLGIRAASVVLRNLLHIRDLADIEARLAELEGE